MKKVFASLFVILFVGSSLLVACQSFVPTPLPTAVPAPTAPPIPTVPPILTVAPASAENRIRLTSGEWTPYLSENLPYFGLASRVVTEAFAEEGVTVEYGYFPWARSFMLAQTGEWDGALIWTKSAEREKDFYYSEPLFDSFQVFFHLKSKSFDWKEIQDLAGLNIGGAIGYDYGEAFTQAEKAGQIKVDRAATDEQNFKKLLLGRIDIFPSDLEVALDILRRNFSPEEIAQITYHPLPVRADPLYLLLSRKVAGNQERMELFNAGLKHLKSSGKLQAFIDESRQGK
jgi:polar amino acid transport system substrate-binding protein